MELSELCADGGDGNTVGKVLTSCYRPGISKISFGCSRCDHPSYEPRSFRGYKSMLMESDRLLMMLESLHDIHHLE